MNNHLPWGDWNIRLPIVWVYILYPEPVEVYSVPHFKRLPEHVIWQLEYG